MTESKILGGKYDVLMYLWDIKQKLQFYSFFVSTQSVNIYLNIVKRAI